MNRLLSHVLGEAALTVECASPEGFINLCAESGVRFRDMRRISATDVTLITDRAGLRKISELERTNGFRVRRTKRAGLIYLPHRFRKRWPLLGLAAVCVLLVWISTLFVWEITVSGNNELSDYEILSELKLLGLDTGTFRGNVDSERLAVDMLIALPRLQWFAVNVRGSRAEVLVRERTEAPIVYDMDEPVMVYAARAGVVTKAIVLSGTACCRKGDAVAAGDILVSGVMESETAKTRFVRALADIYAVTEHDLTAKTPLVVSEKIKTGASRTRFSVKIGKSRINLYLNTRIIWSNYVKMDNERDLALPTGAVLPISLRQTVIEECVLREKTLGLEEAKLRLERELMKQLLETVRGSILETEIEYEVSDGVMTAHLHASCEELISAERPFSASEYSMEMGSDTDG